MKSNKNMLKNNEINSNKNDTFLEKNINKKHLPIRQVSCYGAP